MYIAIDTHLLIDGFSKTTLFGRSLPPMLSFYHKRRQSFVSPACSTNLLQTPSDPRRHQRIDSPAEQIRLRIQPIDLTFPFGYIDDDIPDNLFNLLYTPLHLFSVDGTTSV